MNPDRWQKVKELYEDALTRSPAERLKFLDERCDGDDELRREVESLLGFADDAGDFLEEPAVGEVAELIVSKNRQPTAGDRLSHYEIISKIGEGGMGEVYLATDEKLDRKVAVKILNEEFSRNESNLKRFAREAKAASGLNHPNILVIHEIGADGDRPFFVSEFVEGRTLREVLRGKSLSLTEILDLSIQIAGALAAAHAARIVHRDIKPENIIMRPDGFVKILDFGLAKLVEQKNKSIPGLEKSIVEQHATAKGVILGTVSYMSPEQAKGEPVDERTDIFSFGVLLYEMLAGRTPFAGATVAETFANLINQEPQPLARLPKNAPDALPLVVAKMLRKDVDARYQTAKELLADLKELRENLSFAEKLERSGASGKQRLDALDENHERQTPLLENEPTGAQPDANPTNENAPAATSAEYIFREIRQHKRGMLTVLAILLALAIGLGYWAFSNRTTSTNAPQIESIAVLPFVNASGSPDVEYLSDGMTETLIKSLSNLPNLNVKPRSSVFRYKGKDTDLQTIAKELNVQAILNGRVVQRGDALTLSLELVDVQKVSVIWSESYNRKQSDLVALQSEIARDVLTNLKTKLSGADEQKVAKTGTTDPQAYQLYLKGKFSWNKRTGNDLKQAAEFYRQAIEKDPNYALAFSGLAETYVLFGGHNVASADDSMPLAKAAALRALEIDDSLAEAHSVLGYYLMLYEFDLDRSEKELRRAIELKPNYATAHQWFAANLTVVKRFDEALAEIRLAEELDPLSPDIGTDVGATLVFARRYDEAIAQLKRTLVRDPNFSRAHSYLGWAYGSKGMYREAVAEARTALELNNAFFIKGYLALWLGKSGNRDEALQILTELKKAESEVYVRPSTMAVAYIGLGDKEEALNRYEKEVSSRSLNAIYLAVLPDADDLRAEPRFKAMLKRMNLPQ